MDGSSAALVLIAGALALAAAAALYARRATLHSAALERQVDDLRAQIAASRQEDAQRAAEAAAHLESRVEGHVAEAVAESRATAASVHATLGAHLDAIQKRHAEDSDRLRVIGDAAEIVTRRPLQSFPADAGRLESIGEDEVLAIARSLAALRPLAPYPKWRFDADWSNPDLAFQLRRRVWEYFHDRRREAPLEAGWHGGTRLELYLGNDVSRQIYIAGCFDPNEFAFLDRMLRPGMTFLDIGANEGVYSVFAARRVGAAGAVWSFEPSRREIDRLKRNLAINGLAARVFPIALAESAGEAELTVAGYGHEGQNTIGGMAYEDTEVASRERVEIARLDDIVEREAPARIDAMKLDVEGAELRVLRGAEAALGRYRPIVLFEALEAALRLQGTSRRELCDWLESRGYALHLFDPYSGLPTPAPPGVYGDNMIAVPRESELPEAVYRPWPSSGGEPSRV